VTTGIWPLKEAIDGKVRHTRIPDRLQPVQKYLEPQRRFRRLFQPRRDEAALAAIQATVNAYWDDVRAKESVAGVQA
jgi:pyruvate ferredoxin oxidoreductase beta subunit